MEDQYQVEALSTSSQLTGWIGRYYCWQFDAFQIWGGKAAASWPPTEETLPSYRYIICALQYILIHTVYSYQ